MHVYKPFQVGIFNDKLLETENCFHNVHIQRLHNRDSFSDGVFQVLIQSQKSILRRLGW